MQTLFFMDADSNSFDVANPSTTYSPTVIGGNLENTGDIGNGSINMQASNEAKAGDLSFKMDMGGLGGSGGGDKGGAFDMPDIPDFMNLMPQWRRNRNPKKRLAVLLI